MIKAGEFYNKCKEVLTEKQIANWCSDLYIIKNDITTALVNDYEFKQNVKTFIDNIDHVPWYEIPFEYTPYTEERLKNK